MASDAEKENLAKAAAELAEKAPPSKQASSPSDTAAKEKKSKSLVKDVKGGEVHSCFAGRRRPKGRGQAAQAAYDLVVTGYKTLRAKLPTKEALAAAQREYFSFFKTERAKLPDGVPSQEAMRLINDLWVQTHGPSRAQRAAVCRAAKAKAAAATKSAIRKQLFRRSASRLLALVATESAIWRMRKQPAAAPAGYWLWQGAVKHQKNKKDEEPEEEEKVPEASDEEPEEEEMKPEANDEEQEEEEMKPEASDEEPEEEEIKVEATDEEPEEEEMNEEQEEEEMKPEAADEEQEEEENIADEVPTRRRYRSKGPEAIVQEEP